MKTVTHVRLLVIILRAASTKAQRTTPKLSGSERQFRSDLQDCLRSRLSQACSYSDQSERLAATLTRATVLNEEFDLGNTWACMSDNEKDPALRRRAQSIEELAKRRPALAYAVMAP